MKYLVVVGVVGAVGVMAILANWYFEGAAQKEAVEGEASPPRLARLVGIALWFDVLFFIVLGLGGIVLFVFWYRRRNKKSVLEKNRTVS